MDRSTIEEVVLEVIYKMAKVNAPAAGSANDFPGYPLAARARWAAGIFYTAWPLIVILAWWLIRRAGFAERMFLVHGRAGASPSQPRDS